MSTTTWIIAFLELLKLRAVMTPNESSHLPEKNLKNVTLPLVCIVIIDCRVHRHRRRRRLLLLQLTNRKDGWLFKPHYICWTQWNEKIRSIMGGVRSVHPSVQAEAVGQSDPAQFEQQQDKHDHSHHNSTATTQAAHQTLAAASQRRRRRLLPRRGASVMTNDPRLSEQAHYSTINLFEAWEIMNQFSAWGNASKEVIVHVLDAGLDHLNHNDLGNNLWQNPGEICNDNIDNDGNGLIDDCHGWNHANNNHVLIGDIDHGTHVGGTCIYDLI